tara:strand:- start:3137 stop:4579 length:1443 start_codon:yes stop_codon:yes gene_type:complete
MAQTQQQQYYNSGNYGGYQFVSLDDIINQFMAIYIGEEKLISKASRTDVAFYAQRAVQELSFDTFKSIGSQEFKVPSTLVMPLPHDYVNYTKISWIDGSGIKHRMYPTTRKTSNPKNPYQNSDGDFKLKATATFTDESGSIILDKEYSNIHPGMIVISPYTPAPMNYISTVTSDGTYTTIELADRYLELTGATAFVSDFSDDITIEIQNNDGSLIYEGSTSSYTARDLALPTAGDDFITVSSTDADNIKVGMLATSSIMYTDVVYGAKPDTFVVAIDGTRVTLSKPVGTIPLGQTLNDWNFISQDFQSDTWDSYKAVTPSENNNEDYEDDVYWPYEGERYGLDPQHAQANGSFYMDEKTGKIHFSSNVSGKTVVLDYISDGLYTEPYELEFDYAGGTGKIKEVMPRVYRAPLIHKFAEEAIYKWIAYSIVSGRANVPPVIVQRLRQERFAETRKAKLRLSNIKLEELTQILRGKSKWIKH